VGSLQQCRSGGQIARRVAVGLALGATLVAMTALPAACSARAANGAVPVSAAPTVSASSSAMPAAARQAEVGGRNDWTHVLQVVANLAAEPPSTPVLVLLGGSAARESTIGDASWRTQIAAEGGPVTAAYNLGSRNRTLTENLALVRELPRVPTIVFIGVNLGAFTSAQPSVTLALPEPTASLPPYKQHQYSQNHLRSVTEKHALVSAWLRERYPIYQRNYVSSAQALEELVEACRDRGFRPVLLELPRDTEIIGHRLDAPLARYRGTCRTLAKRYDIPFVSFVAAARLPNRDFYDLWHLVEPGRRTWQQLLSAKSANLLRAYGYGGG